MSNKLSLPTLYQYIRQNQLVDLNNLDAAVQTATQQHTSLFETLISQNCITEDQLLQICAKLLHLSNETIPPKMADYKIANLIPESFARQHLVVPLFHTGSLLTIAINNPFDLDTINAITTMTRCQTNLILTPKEKIKETIAYVYAYHEDPELQNGLGNMSHLFEMGIKLVEDNQGQSDEHILDLAQEAPIAKLVDTILKQALQNKASDIHIEPEAAKVHIRFRIDGLLKDVLTPPKSLEKAIISRLKILANMDITETRKPQDGRISFLHKDREIDFRVSTIRTINGEKLVLRVLDKSGAFVALDNLGLSPNTYQKLQTIMTSTSGIILVCGPTGSGKTSTLYAVLSAIQNPQLNITTIEDPVEYNLPNINQIPVNHKIGMTFATGLKSIVRQDPDVIMVGEIRDIETAQIAMQAALTGHSVLSTVHTRNAAGAITRLIDMGIAPFLLNSAVNAVIGQRLARALCPKCKKAINPSSPTFTQSKHQQLFQLVQARYPDATIYTANGCKNCDKTGYKGRTGLFELMTITPTIGKLIMNQNSADTIQQAAVENGMETMLDDGLEKIKNGITSIEEIARVLDITTL